jgi:hypothetical protein
VRLQQAVSLFIAPARCGTLKGFLARAELQGPESNTELLVTHSDLTQDAPVSIQALSLDSHRD